MKIKLHIGLDVHKNSVVIATANFRGDDPEHYGKWGGSLLSSERGLVRLLKKFDLEKDEVRICYEAGPTGFTLARRLIQIGYDCIVVAPSEIPKKSGEKIKTDRRDARKLARLLRAGELTGIHIPTPKNEAVRDLVRARTDASEARTKCRQQLAMFLLRNGVHYQINTKWGSSHMNHLRRLKLNDPAQNIVLEEYIMAIDAAHDRVTRLEEQMQQQLEHWDGKPYVEALMAFRGFKVVAAMIIIAELGDLSRFDHPRQLMNYLGIVPGEESTGTKRRQGAITKCGNGHARWMLIESASHYRHQPKVGQELSKRQAGQSREIKALSWRTQNRLCFRFRALSARGIHRNKVVVAVARELSAFIWEMHQTGQLKKSTHQLPPHHDQS